MRVGFPIDKFIVGEGLPGIDKVCYYLVRELGRLEGLEVVLFQDKYKDPGPFGEFEVIRFPSLRDLPFVGGAGGRGDGGGEKDTFRQPSKIVLFAKDVLKRWTIEQSGVDILHYPTHLERPYRLSRAVPIMTVHDLVPFRCAETCTDRVKWEMAEALKRFDRVEHFIADSENTKQDMINLLKMSGDDITVVYPGISSQFQPSGTTGVRERVSGGRPYLLFLGTVEPRKNLVNLLRAFAGLEDDLILVVSGLEGWGIGEVAQAIRDFSLGDRVRLIGFTPEEELPALYSGAELFVYPSLYEGFGLPPVEAMACGTPVASSTGGSLPEVLGDAAVYFEPGDVEGMREAIRTLLIDGEMRKQCVERGFERARTYSWRNCALGVCDVYRKFS